MIFIGTSGFMYWGWKGTFYPFELPPSKWLEYYAEHFNALEINSTFYRLPVRSSIKNYKKRAPELTYIFKLYRGITHYRQLADENVSPFFMIKDILGENLYSLLAQFPESFKPSEKSFDFLVNLFEKFKGISSVVELRAPEWLEHLGFFRERKIPVCCSDFPQSLNWLKECVQTEKTAYFRFHGRRKLYSNSYTDEELKEFAKKINVSHSENKLCFFNNTSKGYAVENALKLKEYLNLSLDNNREEENQKR